MERERHRSRGRPANRTVAVAQRGLSRRRVVGGALGLAGASAIGAGLARPGGGFADLIGRAAAQAGADLCEPAVWASDNGLLRVELVAGNDPARGPGAVAYGGDGHVCEGGGGGFGGLVPGPTLRLFPGDRLKLTLKNRTRRTCTSTACTSGRSPRATTSSSRSSPGTISTSSTRSRSATRPGSSGTTRTTTGWHGGR